MFLLAGGQVPESCCAVLHAQGQRPAVGGDRVRLEWTEVRAGRDGQLPAALAGSHVQDREGLVAALLDEISGRAQMGSDPMDPRFMFTAKLEVKYRKNVPIGRQLKILGKAGRSRSKSAEAWAGIYDAETHELLAEGNTLLIDVPADQFDSSRLSELGWKVYPD